MTDEEYTFLTKHIFKLTNIDLDYYNSQQMRRRLTFFIETTNNKHVDAYCKLLETDANSLKKLNHFLTINVTEFFRDDWAYVELKNTILPQLIASYRILNIWSCGCSNGAEPYSIAMLLKELTGHSRHKILGTDLDDMSLAKAIAGGPYAVDNLKNVPEEYVRKYLVNTENGLWVKPEIMKMVKFEKHNTLANPFAKDFHLICCRNVTIYFTDEAKTNLNKKFCQSLLNNGVLFIGATEFIPNPPDLGFKKIGTCFYQKIPVVPHSNQAKQKVFVKI